MIAINIKPSPLSLSDMTFDILCIGTGCVAQCVKLLQCECFQSCGFAYIGSLVHVRVFSHTY